MPATSMSHNVPPGIVAARNSGSSAAPSCADTIALVVIWCTARCSTLGVIACVAANLPNARARAEPAGAPTQGRPSRSAGPAGVGHEAGTAMRYSPSKTTNECRPGGTGVALWRSSATNRMSRSPTRSAGRPSSV
nr:hypothetical protein [Catenulispora pinisilvae]